MTCPCRPRPTAILLLLALALPFRTAAAHPRLVRAVPAVDSHLPAAPRSLSVTFNEPLTVAVSRLTLLDAKQQPVALDALQAAPDDAKTLTAKILGPMPAGRYTVKWHAGGADGHPVRRRPPRRMRVVLMAARRSPAPVPRRCRAQSMGRWRRQWPRAHAPPSARFPPIRRSAWSRRPMW